MKAHEKIKAYQLLIEKVQINQYPSKQELLEYLERNDLIVSERSFDRIKEELRDYYGISIKYSRGKKGFFLEYDLTEKEFDAFLQLLASFNAANIVWHSLKDGTEALKYIRLESAGLFKGAKYLDKVLKAVKANIEISFMHYNFHSGVKKQYTVQPYILREYQNRWYVLSYVPELDSFRTFGLDRISDLVITGKTFKPEMEKKASHYFENAFGLVYDQNNVEFVELSFTPTQGKYIKTLPFHHTQEILVDNDEELRIRIAVYPNFELRQKILMQLDTVKVISPKWLAEDIKRIADTIIRKYE